MSEIKNPTILLGNIPVGGTIIWFTATPPTDWLICDGSSFSGVTYPDLALVLGGTTLPDMRDVFPIGAATKLLGSTGGSLGHTHTQPTHTHTGPDHNHTITHTHAVDPPNTTSTSAGTHTHDSHTTAQVGILGLLSPGLNGPTTHSSTGTAHTHDTNIASFTSGGPSDANTGSSGTGNTGASGGDATGGNDPPFRAVNFIIRAA